MGVIIIGASIDLSKIDKNKIINGKGDSKSKYYNFDIIVNDDFDKFNNNVQIVEKQSKEQRFAKDKRVFLGNGRTVFNSKNKDSESEPENQGRTIDDSDSLPF